MIANALGPIFLLILLGAFLRRSRFPGENFWPGVEKLTYFVLLPSLLIHRLAFADISNAPFGKIALAITVALVLVSLGVFAVRRFTSANGPAFTSVFQGAVRFNSYVGLAIANELYGEVGFVLGAVTVAIMIPLANLLCVMSFNVVSHEHHFRWKTFGLSIIQNPLIVACVLGIALNITGIGLPGWSGVTLGILSAAALPLGLLAVGVAIDVSRIHGATKEIATSSAFRFFVVPVLMLMACQWLGLPAASQQILMLFACLPTASSSYILARQLGGDTTLMANIITVQTLVAFAAMPVWISISEKFIAG